MKNLKKENTLFPTVYGFNLNLLQKNQISDFLKGTRIQFLLPLQKRINEKTIFHVLRNKEKIIKIRLKKYGCKEGDLIEMIPLSRDDSLELEFYKIAEGKQFLVKYRLEREPLCLLPN